MAAAIGATLPTTFILYTLYFIYTPVWQRRLELRSPSRRRALLPRPGSPGPPTFSPLPARVLASHRRGPGRQHYTTSTTSTFAAFGFQCHPAAIERPCWQADTSTRIKYDV